MMKKYKTLKSKMMNLAGKKINFDFHKILCFNNNFIYFYIFNKKF